MLYKITSPILRCINQLGENIGGEDYWVSHNFTEMHFFSSLICFKFKWIKQIIAIRMCHTHMWAKTFMCDPLWQNDLNILNNNWMTAVITQQIWNIDPMLFHCWTSVVHDGPTLKQHWVSGLLSSWFRHVTAWTALSLVGCRILCLVHCLYGHYFPAW